MQRLEGFISHWLLSYETVPIFQKPTFNNLALKREKLSNFSEMEGWDVFLLDNR